MVATAGAMAAGRWSNLVEPSSHASPNSRGSVDSFVASSLATEAGLRSPRLGWLVAFLAVYVVVVGPVLFLAVRRRRRPELAWVAVPLVAVLFSAGSYALGRNLRQATQLVQGTVLSSGAAGTNATTYLGVFSRGGRTARVGFPLGWSTASVTSGGTSGAGVAGLQLTADGPDARVPLDAGQFALVAATGPVPSVGGLEITAATGAGGLVTGTVRNTTKLALEDVAVFAGLDAVNVGKLGPGAERTWTVANPVAAARTGAAAQMWWIRGPSDAASVADPALWQAASQGAGQNFLASGAVVAAGWTRDYLPAVRVDGRAARPQGRTVVVARGPVRVGAATDPLDFAVRQDVVRDPSANLGNFSVVRMVLPPGTAASGLVMRGPLGSAEFWVDGAWVPAGALTGATGGSGVANVIVPVRPCAPTLPCLPDPTVFLGRGVVPGLVGPPVQVPEGAVHDGVVFARVPGFVTPSSGVQVTLGRAT